MESLKSNVFSNKKQELIEVVNENMKDPTYKKLVQDLHISKEVASLNNSKLEDSASELKNCANCKGLFECKNKVLGHFLYPKVVDNTLDLNYVACSYKIENDKRLSKKNSAQKELENARFKDIDVNDKKRVQLIKWMKEFYDHYDNAKENKGLYLHGSFGSGKTYLLYALLNELKINKKVDYVALYFPEILRTLKDNWDTYADKINYYSQVEILLLDDIGSEQVSEWARDEVLGTILQNRMNNHLTTFFTSNLTLEELEEHLSLAKGSMDKVKARRILERIKQLTKDLELITDNKRK